MLSRHIWNINCWIRQQASASSSSAGGEIARRLSQDDALSHVLHVLRAEIARMVLMVFIIIHKSSIQIIYIHFPSPLLFTKSIHKPIKLMLPAIKADPLNACRPVKLGLPSLFFRIKAPPMGDPMRLAKAPIPCAMPNRAPSTFGSGHTTGNTLGGKGISPPEKQP